MFTGLIEEIGEISAIRPIGAGKRISVKASKILDDLKIDDSVALNGACQTVVAVSGNQFEVEAVEETLRKSSLGQFRPGMKINLERAARLGDRMGGHLVQGHVDTIGTIANIQKESAGILVWVAYPSEYAKYIIPTGSVTIDGISLTTARVEANRFMVSVIPHTWKLTNLNNIRIGSYVNLEFDVLGKYIEKMLKGNKRSSLEQYIDQPDY